MRIYSALVASLTLPFSLAPSLLSSPRDIQFRTIDIEASVMELHNFGDETEDLSSWRFCSHDESVTRRYSSSSGLNGISLAPGESLFLHVLQDAPADDPSRINFPGSIATPLDQGPYGLQIYFPTSSGSISFGNSNLIADHLQWAIDGVDNTRADERSDEAQSGGVWTNQNLWIATTSETTSLQLLDTTGTVLHGPENYQAVTIAEAAPDSFELDSITVEGSEVVLTWTPAEGAFYQIRRATSLENGTDSFGEPIAIVQAGTFIDEQAPVGRAFYQVTELLP